MLKRMTHCCEMFSKIDLHLCKLEYVCVLCFGFSRLFFLFHKPWPHIHTEQYKGKPLAAVQVTKYDGGIRSLGFVIADLRAAINFPVLYPELCVCVCSGLGIFHRC